MQVDLLISVNKKYSREACACLVVAFFFSLCCFSRKFVFTTCVFELGCTNKLQAERSLVVFFFFSFSFSIFRGGKTEKYICIASVP